MTWWALADSPPQCHDKVLYELPWASKLFPDPCKKHQLCTGRCTPTKPRREADECTQRPCGFTVMTVHFSPLLKASQRCHGTCLGGTTEHRLLPSSPGGDFWKGGGPAAAGSCASALPSTKQCSLPSHSHKLIQTTLFFQNNEGGSASREWEFSWHLIQICEQLLTRNYF